MIEPTIHEWFFSRKQTEALETLEKQIVDDLLYGGAKGGGKSYFGTRWCYLQAKKLIALFELDKPLDHPLLVGFMGRKRGSDFVKTTLETWKKAIPPELYRLKSGDREIIIEEKVKIFYGGMDSEETVHKFNSAEFAFVFIDQAEEITRTDLALLKGTLRLKYNNIEPEFKTLLTANPAPCFLRSDYILKPPKDGSKVFIQALPADNPYLPKEYIKNLEEAFKHRPELVQAYIYGNWDQLEGSEILIKHSWAIAATEGKVHNNLNRRVTVADVALHGTNETVIYNMVDCAFKGQQIHGQKDATYTAMKIVEMAAENNSDIIAIDADGLGGPVADMVEKILRDTGVKRTVLRIHSGKTKDLDPAYDTKRSQMWWEGARVFAESNTVIPDDPVLIGQLCAVKYDLNSTTGKRSIEKKVETTKRTEGDLDRADSWIYGLYATSKVPVKALDFDRQDEQQTSNHDSYGWGQHQEEAVSGSWRY